MHLTPDQFVDIVDGTRTEASLPHLAECGSCRDELASLRAVMNTAGDASVPEPSPLFWNQLSARVRERIDAEPKPRRWWNEWLHPVMVVPAAAVALIALLVASVVVPQSGRRPPTPAVATVAGSDLTPGSAMVDVNNEPVDMNDPLLLLVADLSATADWDAASVEGFAEPEFAEHAITHMNADELQALRQVLQQELGRPGA